MALRTWFPKIASGLKAKIVRRLQTPQEVEPSIDSIPPEEQVRYALNFLRSVGLTQKFAPWVVLCGHGSSTQNNAYATSLDCGACGGRHGASNARILAAILNASEIREALRQNGIAVPSSTRFVAAEHNTTTDQVTLYGAPEEPALQALKNDLLKAGAANARTRLATLEKNPTLSEASSNALVRSEDWAQARPEWGLARNACFIVAPRALTADLDLEGRAFLHSYEPDDDPQGHILTTILTAPMVVASWINLQYLFSTVDNVAFGGGSKVTKNITGKFGIVQGNASDLMTGLSLQSVFSSDSTPYHIPQRLTTVVFAPRTRLDPLLKQHAILKKLFGNGWVHLVVMEPDTRATYFLSRDFSWTPLH